MKILSENNNHICIFGVTRSGKSYFGKKAMQGLSCGAVYFNIQGEKNDFGRSTVTAHTGDVMMDDLVHMVAQGVHVNLIFDNVRDGYDITAGYIINKLMQSGFNENDYIYIFIDEAHLLKGYSKMIAEMCATSGLKNGIRLVIISQRPALCSKTLYTQCFEHYLFQLPKSEGAYFKGKGIPYDDCLPLWGEPYSRKYIYYNDFEGVKGCEPI